MWKTCRRVFLVLVLIFLYLPILILAVYSFTESTNIGAIRSFSMQNYVTLFTTPELRDMILGTLALALGSAALATILGTIGAIGAFYSSRKVNSGISMVFLPAMTNYVVLDMLYNSTYIMGSLIGSYFSAYNWHGGSMIALILLAIICIFTLLTSGMEEEDSRAMGGARL